MNFKSELQIAQDFIQKAHHHLKQVSSNSIESEACYFAINEHEKAQQKTNRFNNKSMNRLQKKWPENKDLSHFLILFD